MLNKLSKYIKSHKPEITVLIILLMISGISHAINMFRFPYYENDEGVYVSQAWSLLTQGKLAPYTYWYDHAPAGWILIALWTKLTGGFFTFGLSVNSGRVLMLVLHLFSSVFLFYIAKRLTGSLVPAIISVLIFSLSPLGIYFQRRVLLDNIMIFWVLMSLLLLTKKNYRLSNVILSALIFGIAVLSKESAIFFIPLFIYIVYSRSNTYNRTFNTFKWIAVCGLLISFYGLYALLKKEFFPIGFLGNQTPHVSLLNTLKDQYSRGGGGIIDMQKSTFWNDMSVWINEDPLIILLGALATFLNLVAGIWDKNFRIISLFSLSYWLFLMRGGLVIEFYVIPLIPLLALNIGFLTWQTKKAISYISSKHLVSNISYIPSILMIFIVVISSLYYSTNVRGNLNIYKSDQTTSQKQAIDWILARQNPNAFFVIDNYGYVDLQTRSNNNFKNAEWYWKVDRDPAISLNILHDNPEQIGYIALTPQMEHDLESAGLNLTLEAWHASTPIKRFWNDGWGVEFWVTKYPDRVLQASWDSYKPRFIKNGQVIDPSSNTSTSEGESYALLRSVWQDDRKTFDQVLDWSNSNLKLSDNLYAWKWQNGKVLDSGTATDADQDIALSLLFAYKKWKDDRYLILAQNLLNSIWSKEVANVNGQNYVIAGNWANHSKSITINPSYLSPSHYRIFADADKAHDWNDLVATSYKVLNECTKANLDKEKGILPPEWCALDKTNLKFRQDDPDQPQGTDYSFNAVRVPWRISLDYQWNNANEAMEYLKTLNLLNSEYKSKGKIATTYQHDGQVSQGFESVLGYAGSMGYFQTIEPKEADDIYKNKILAKFYEDDTDSYWEDVNNYYTQNWAWFASALYNYKLKNLWTAKM